MTTAQDGGKVVSLHPQEILLVLISVRGRIDPRKDFMDFMSMKNSNDTSWHRTSDLPICSTVP